MNQGLPIVIQNSMQKIFIKYPILRVKLFGSRAKGTHSPASDIDLAIYAPQMTHQQMNLLRNELDELNIIYRIDVVHIEELTKNSLIERIENEGIEIYRREDVS